LSDKSYLEKDGHVVRLSPATAKHIREKHGILDLDTFIAEALREPTAILHSKWEPDTRLYFKASGHLYKAVIVAWASRRIKTAHLMRAIEGGDAIWRAPSDSG
jgi:hypothetical protein